MAEAENKSRDRPTLSQRVETMQTIIESLTETLADLTCCELEDFKHDLLGHWRTQRPHCDIPWMLLGIGGALYSVFSVVQMFGLQSVELTKDLLMRMNKPDVAQGLTGASSIAQKNLPADELPPKAIYKVALVAAVKQMLLESLRDLSSKEFEDFTQLLCQMEIDSLGLVKLGADREVATDELLEKLGQRSVKVTSDVFFKMNRTDFVERLSEFRVTPPASASVQKETAADQQILSEALNTLSDEEFKKFKCLLQPTYFQRGLEHISWTRLEAANRGDVVCLMVQHGVQQAVQVTTEILMDINKPDLVHRLSKASEAHKDPHKSVVITPQIDAFMDKNLLTEEEMLLENLASLSNAEFQELKRRLPEKGLPETSRKKPIVDVKDMVESMVRILGQDSMNVTKRVLEEMDRGDLVQMVEFNSGIKSSPMEKVQSMSTVKRMLSTTLECLSYREIKEFRKFLQMNNIPRALRKQMGMSERRELLKQTRMLYGKDSLRLISGALLEMRRTYMSQEMGVSYSGSKVEEPLDPQSVEGCGKLTVHCTGSPVPLGPNTASADPPLFMESCDPLGLQTALSSLELGASGASKKSTNWTKLEPGVSNDEEEGFPIYSLQCEEGMFECSITELRWVCKETVSFEYHFCCWEEHIDRMESLFYMPAGPLINIKVITGELDEVYLPHWICIDHDLVVLDKFAVLHINECGDTIEQASEITSSHIKLREPVFSPRGGLMKLGFPVKWSCRVLMFYKTDTAFLSLHVYLIPHDSSLNKTVERNEARFGYARLHKPSPDPHLKMKNVFTLHADTEKAKICPKQLTLRYDVPDPNFFELHLPNLEGDFNLSLENSNTGEPVWDCNMYKVDFQNPDDLKERQKVTEVQRQAAVISIQGRLLGKLDDLSIEELNKFKWWLKNKHIFPNQPCIPWSQVEKADRVRLVDLILQTYPTQAWEVTRNILERIPRKDLL